MNYLMLSVGRRCELLKNFRTSIKSDSKIIATDLSPYAPALYFADKQYIVPRIDDPLYVGCILDICKKEKINAVTTLIDPEIEILAENRALFEQMGIEVLAPYTETAKLCFDKYLMFEYLKKNNIETAMTWNDIEKFREAYENHMVKFPVFVKPRTGSGSVGARIILDYEALIEAIHEDSSLIIQEYMDGLDIDVDVYVDTISHQAVSAFAKKKIETRIGGASKTISFIDTDLYEYVKKIVSIMQFNGPIDMDFFYRDGKYYLSEINPRFGGAYLHAYGAGVDFIKNIETNLAGVENKPCFGNYDEDIVMMMYDSVVIKKKEDLA